MFLRFCFRKELENNFEQEERQPCLFFVFWLLSLEAFEAETWCCFACIEGYERQVVLLELVGIYIALI